MIPTQSLHEKYYISVFGMILMVGSLKKFSNIVTLLPTAIIDYSTAPSG